MWRTTRDILTNTIYFQKNKLFIGLVIISAILNLSFFYSYDYELLYSFGIYFLIISLLSILVTIFNIIISCKKILIEYGFSIKMLHTKELYDSLLNALYVLSPLFFILLNLVTVLKIILKRYLSFAKFKFYFYYIFKIEYKLRELINNYLLKYFLYIRRVYMQLVVKIETKKVTVFNRYFFYFVH
ncbi:hypothetical protein SCORR_v1c01230 [Spiroplasma corruscae]|uniref:Transmembrane protein n=1 Tax=Spiroplasma corruscae TaxID=216934 RepID=A0A222EN45_9MOLU|nr:hypothetical protein SCORR_v1c01230 [Spiroplasma corruscae]